LDALGRNVVKGMGCVPKTFKYFDHFRFLDGVFFSERSRFLFGELVLLVDGEPRMRSAFALSEGLKSPENGSVIFIVKRRIDAGTAFQMSLSLKE
jgi:hypothetical protein